MGRSIAVVGSGPGGMYAVQGLLDRVPDCQVDVMERLPSPFGLIRGGVAPDHQKTKRVSKAYERTLSNPRVRYFGNVEVGRDIRVPNLLCMYDAVVLAYGAPHDNKLGVAGEDLPNVFGSNAFVGWYNGHPDFKDLNPDLDVRSAAIIGVGNVALDVARVLSKTSREMSTTDLVAYAAEATTGSPLEDVFMIGRRGPVEATFTNVELREMGELENAAPVIDPDHLPGKIVANYMSDRDLRLREKNVETMRSFLNVSPKGKKKRIYFDFFLSPMEILGNNRVEGVRCERTKVDIDGKVRRLGEVVDIPAEIVITCIGSRAFPIDNLPFNDASGTVVNEGGKVSNRLYAVGWLKRGAAGTIGTNKNDSLEVVDRLVAEFNGPERDGCAAIDTFFNNQGTRIVSFEEWQIIDRLEVEAASDGAPRKKFVTPQEMIVALELAQSA